MQNVTNTERVRYHEAPFQTMVTWKPSCGRNIPHCAKKSITHGICTELHEFAAIVRKLEANFWP
jgi:hypothetical protein